MRYETEIWRDVVGYEGRYLVSSVGMIKSVQRTALNGQGKLRRVPEKMITQWYNHRGYAMVSLHNTGKRGFAVHLLVAKAFIPNPENKPEVNHIDGVKTNNNVKNLEWNTRLENQQHSVYVLGKHQAGERHHNAKITVEQVLKIRELHKTGLYSMAAAGRLCGVLDKDQSARIIKGEIWKTLLKKEKNEI